jgi:hypothetical protein
MLCLVDNYLAVSNHQERMLDTKLGIGMKKLNQSASAIFNKLVEGLDQVGDAKKIDNAPGCFMAVHVDYIWKNKHGRHYAIGHHYIQEGDVMNDPEMVFLASVAGIFPMSFQQDNLGLYQVAILAEDNASLRYAPKLQASLTIFTNDWMENIRQQQNLNISAPDAPAP